MDNSVIKLHRNPTDDSSWRQFFFNPGLWEEVGVLWNNQHKHMDNI